MKLFTNGVISQKHGLGGGRNIQKWGLAAWNYPSHCEHVLESSSFICHLPGHGEENVYSMLGHDVLPHTGPETREPAAMDENFSHCESIICPLNCFSPASVMVTKMSALRVCTTSCSFQHHKYGILSWEGAGLVLGARRTAGRRCVFFSSLCEEYSVLSAPPEKKRRFGGLELPLENKQFNASLEKRMLWIF